VTITNLSASVQARLQNHARATKRPFQQLLQYYAMERLLYRLSRSPHRTRFVLKGALMLYVWDAPLARATKDPDFLGRLDNTLENRWRRDVARRVPAADRSRLRRRSELRPALDTRRSVGHQRVGTMPQRVARP
jgi:hypothetical protein